MNRGTELDISGVIEFIRLPLLDVARAQFLYWSKLCCWEELIHPVEPLINKNRAHTALGETG